MPSLTQMHDEIARLIKLQKAPSAGMEMAILYKANKPNFDMDRYSGYFSDIDRAEVPAAPPAAPKTASIPITERFSRMTPLLERDDSGTAPACLRMELRPRRRLRALGHRDHYCCWPAGRLAAGPFLADAEAFVAGNTRSSSRTMPTARSFPFLTGFLLWHRRAALRETPRTPCLGALALFLPCVALLLWSSGAGDGLGHGHELSDVSVERNMARSGNTLDARGRLPAGVSDLDGSSARPPAERCHLWQSAFLHRRRRPDAAGLSFHSVIVGSVIQMDNFSLFVDVPCSGLKNLLSLMMISSAFAYLLDGPPARRIALFLFSIPLSIGVNIARLTLLGIAGECFGTHAAHVFHDWDGLLSLLLAVTVLFWFARRIGYRTFAGWPLF